MRIALLSYRSKPHCGGQGIYVRHLSRELTNLGHSVEVFSGQPYPDLDAGVTLTKVPSLDLYREPDPFRVPKPREFRDLVDVEEFATMCTAGFPEPKTFSKRVAKLLRSRPGEFDIVHDNQVLGYGMLDIERQGLPLITTVHHPITFDRRIDLEAATTWRKKLSTRRWYGFLRMQQKVARQARKILTPSESSARDIARDFGVDPARMQVILLGVDDMLRAAHQASGAWPDHRDGQCGRSHEGHLDPARVVRQAAHRARPRAVAGHQAQARWPHRAADRRARDRRLRLVRQRGQRRRAGRADGLGRDRLRALALRGVLAAHRRADGLRHPARRLPGRCHPRGHRPRRPLRRPGHPRRRGRADGRPGRPARRPRAPRRDGPGRTQARR